MEIPRGWQKGELLDVKNKGYEFEIKPVFAHFCADDLPVIKFATTDETQAFVSWWYMRELGP